MMAPTRSSVEGFYARQVHLLNDGDIDGWSRTFAEDAVLTQRAKPGRVFARNASAERGGREHIAAAALRKLAAENAVRRHWISALDVRDQPDGAVVHDGA